MAAWTRRDLLRCALLTAMPAAALPLLTACGQSPERPATPFGMLGQRPALATPVGSSGSPRSPATPLATGRNPGPSVTPVYNGGNSGLCTSLGYRPHPLPEEPYYGGVIAEMKAFSFAEKAKMPWACIVVGTVREILPARWNTADGQRPANPHNTYQMLIFTPVRVEIDRVVVGSYTLPSIYLAAPGGKIGQDCASYTGSGAWPSFLYGGRFLYYLQEAQSLTVAPAPDDNRYRYFTASYSYTVKPDDTLTISPEYDIMGGHVDDPPRTITVDEAAREIVTLRATPAATPTR